MNTEQDRLDFEAKHKVPDGAIYIPEDNIYVWAGAEKLPWQYRSGPSEYNTLWQGYQSALEDRQGEAVAEVKLITGAPNSVIPFAPYIDIVASQPLPVGTQLFASPQPAQPEQWNAAIDVETIERLYDKNWHVETSDSRVHATPQELIDFANRCILALRKGA